MASEILDITHAPSKNVYFVIRNPLDDKVLDHADGLFDTLGAATTPGLAATEKSAFGGVSQSGYQASLNLAQVNSGPLVKQFFIEAYERAGGSQNLANDLHLATSEMRVASGELVIGGSPGAVAAGYVVKCCMVLTSTTGDACQLWAWVERNGVPIALDPADECVFDCFEHTSGLSQFSGPTDPVNPNAENIFEDTFSPTDFSDNTGYTLIATVTIGGATITGQECYPCVGSA